MKTSELTGAALDWAVAKCEGVSPKGFAQFYGYVEGADEDCPVGAPMYTYATIWDQMGPIIEREHIALDYAFDDGWLAVITREVPGGIEQLGGFGTTPLVAAARCYVMSKLGEEVEVPC